ncbi:type II toxin-antitoxin system RelE/ParE family toxin [Pseudomonas sp.]|jgi:plasmid stabilization system protein ParE|uniref:type II toxin-antitoxin system RelE/ParE family toxin n=1 Tax=Pseudomonas sp. TaxID=306 RepID=UPI002730AD17|nr:type II toxin-antitoxin system RelE/ParE family toxin [Pseudomonas sp.]MDP2244454.1 type II toxin-antitoxin system RelE/ParE family toxin [Pseudomonas sp.]
MQIKWLRTALRNLDEEIAFIAAEDPQAAQRTASRILAAIALLETQPDLGRPGRVPGTRELVVLDSRYLIPYRVNRQIIEILRVFHTSRSQPQRW